ncbi:MAG: DUF11 domain-containing protein [Acidobacteriota bacterium]|nr:DUF11 domain-containing protein [Acidobacteriota bacterium]
MSRTLSAQDPIGVTKLGVGQPIPGNNFSYTIHVTNPDAVNSAANAQLTDAIPAQMTFVSAVQNSGPAFNPCVTPAIGSAGTITCTAANFPGASGDAVFTFTFHVASIATGTTSNTATVSTTSADFAGDNTATILHTYQPQADLSVTKTGPPFVIAGANITYTINVSNSGPSDAQTISMSDPLFGRFQSITQTSGPAFSCMTPPVGVVGGTVTCTTATLPAGITASFQLVEKSDPSGTGMFPNQVTVMSTTLDPGPNPNIANTATQMRQDADLQVTKAGPLTATAGQPITYTITAVNNGPTDATFVSLTDALPANLTFQSWTQNTGPLFSCGTPAVGSSGTILCSNGVLTSGASATFTLVAKVVSTVANGGSVSNTATITAPTSPPISTDSNPFNNSSTATTTISRLADLSVVKTSGAATVQPGNNITYTVTVNNSGPSDAATVALTDVIPTGTTFVSNAQSPGPTTFSCTNPPGGGTGTINCTAASLPAGGSATFTIVVQNNTSNLANTTISNTAEVSTTTSESTLANNSSTANVTVSAAGLAVSKSASPNPVQAGANITYTVTVSNVGNTGAHNVSLTDAVPANTTFVSETQTSGPAFACATPAVGATGTVTCNNALFAAGASADFQIVVRVNPAATNGTTITNTANASTTDTDPNLSNNTATTTTTVVVGSDVSVAKTGPASIGSGSNIAYTVTVSNIGTSDALGVTLGDVIPSGATFFSESQTGGPLFTCSNPSVGGTGTISCSIGTLGVGATATFSITLTANAAPGSTITNTATVSSTSTDANAGNNSASASTVVAGPDLAVTKTDAPDPVTPGSNITYTITVMNNGTGGANNVSLSDTLPAGTTFLSETQTAGPAFTCMNPAPGASGTVNCTIALLGAATTATIQVVVQVGASVTAGTIISNTATASTTSTEPNLTNNSATTTTTVSAITIADLVITKSDSPDPVSAGSSITYTIVVTNNGSAAAASVSLSDAVPPNTTFAAFTAPAGWTPSAPPVGGTGTVTATNPSLAAGGSATFSLVVTVNGGVAGGTAITNTANVTTTSTETSTANNSATATTTVAVVVGPPTTTADVSITKTSSAGTVQPGGQITYTITALNNGPATATGVSVSDSIPAGTSFVSATPTQGSCAGTATVICTIGSLSPMASASITLIVTAPSTTGLVINSASVASTSSDPASANNTSTTSVAVVSNIPVLSPLLLALLALVFAAIGLYMKPS